MQLHRMLSIMLDMMQVQAELESAAGRPAVNTVTNRLIDGDTSIRVWSRIWHHPAAIINMSSWYQKPMGTLNANFIPSIAWVLPLDMAKLR